MTWLDIGILLNNLRNPKISRCHLFRRGCSNSYIHYLFLNGLWFWFNRYKILSFCKINLFFNCVVFTATKWKFFIWNWIHFLLCFFNLIIVRIINVFRNLWWTVDCWWSWDEGLTKFLFLLFAPPDLKKKKRR